MGVKFPIRIRLDLIDLGVDGRVTMAYVTLMKTTANKVPALSNFDWIVISSSGGKDSQAQLDLVVELADAQDCPRERLVVVHADLGRVEWQDTKELAAAQAAHYGLRFIITRRTQNDLLDHVETRGMWPSNKTRYCTSDHKRGPIRRVYTALARETKTKLAEAGKPQRPARLLSAMGMRSQESPARAKRPYLIPNEGASTKTTRKVHDWLPIKDWTTRQVWDRIKASGVPYHPAYDLGMSRLSCVFCIFAPKDALVTAGRANPKLLKEYVRVESCIGHTFRQDTSLKDIQVLVNDTTYKPRLGDWGPQ